MRILITGAAGNLGSLLAQYLLSHEVGLLRLMVFRRDVPADLKVAGKTEIVRADLSQQNSLATAVKGVDVIVHFAGVLFKANPEHFLSTTNTSYFKNLVDVAKGNGIRRIILISFPHVEGPTSIEKPAKGRLDRTPISVHAKTRLEEEQYLFANAVEPISLRVGMVYGRGILMIDAAHWLAKRRLLGVWKERTQIHLISKNDFCAACTAAITNGAASGIYHIGDEGNVSLQEFLELACRQWKLGRPWTMPLWVIYAAAELCELYSRITGSVSPLTRDFIDIGRVSYYGDTNRMRRDLLPVLKYRTITEGVSSL
jgi:nucleoside-diphosphate-sugar epimerase